MQLYQVEERRKKIILEISFFFNKSGTNNDINVLKFVLGEGFVTVNHNANDCSVFIFMCYAQMFQHTNN